MNNLFNKLPYRLKQSLNHFYPELVNLPDSELAAWIQSPAILKAPNVGAKTIAEARLLAVQVPNA